MKEFIIGIDFGKTNVRYAICENEPELKYYTKEPYGRGSAAEMHQQIFAGIDKCIAESGYDKEGLIGIGIDVPAVVDREEGTIVWGPDWDFLAGASLTKPIEERYGVPVVADVDTVMAAWGEQWAGVGKDCNRFALLTWGTGLGAGIVIGCADTLVCGGGIARHGQLAVQDGKETMLKELCGGDIEKITSPMVFDAADAGDKVAIAILDRVAVLLGRVCKNVVLTMQPEKIVIVGGLAERSKWVLDTINKTMKESCWLIFKGLTNCDVVCSELGDSAGVLGAIRKVQKVLEKIGRTNEED